LKTYEPFIELDGGSGKTQFGDKALEGQYRGREREEEEEEETGGGGPGSIPGASARIGIPKQNPWWR
jgi:hypothetical protein